MTDPHTLEGDNGQGVPSEFVLDRMRAASARLQIVILDACRSNPLRPKGVTIRPGLALQEPPGGALVAYAAASGGIAVDGPPGQNSPYVRHLVEAIQRPELPIQLALERVHRAVIRESRGIQKPVYVSMAPEDFYFLP